MIEEVGATYTYHIVIIRAGEQKAPEHLALNPNAKMLVIIDQDGSGGAPITVVESGAILLSNSPKSTAASSSSIKSR